MERRLALRVFRAAVIILTLRVWRRYGGLLGGLLARLLLGGHLGRGRWWGRLCHDLSLRRRRLQSSVGVAPLPRQHVDGDCREDTEEEIGNV